MASQLARHRSDTSLSENTNTTSAPSINNVIVTVFLCLLVFVLIYIGAVRAVLLDVAPLAAPVANVFFIGVRDGLQQSTRRQQRRRADGEVGLRRRPF